MTNCIYKSEQSNGQAGECLLHGECIDRGESNKMPSCEHCRDKLSIGDRDFAVKWRDPLEIVDRDRQQSESLRNMLAGASVFLLCGGPSVNVMPLEQLSRRGVWTMAVNNAAGHPKVRPQAFLCSDPPLKFTHSVWLDPAVRKFVPTAKLGGGRAKLKKKIDGEFSDLGRKTTDCPDVWGFRRESWFWPDDRFFTSKGAQWGNHQSGVEKTGERKCVCTMLLAMRLLKYLGAKRVYMLGVDFRMSMDWGYSFGQGRTEGACRSNNEHYEIVNEQLCRMQEGGTFGRFGIEFYNCYDRSGLRAFDYVSFLDAVEDCKSVECGRRRKSMVWIEDVPDLAEWYEKK